MFTAQELVETQRRSWTVNEIHLHCLDVLTHVLRGDVDATVFKDQTPNRRFLDELKDEMGIHAETSGIDMAEEHWFRPERRTIEVSAEQGSLDVGRYIDRDELCFDEPVKVRKQKPGVTIVLDAVLPYRDRQKHYMKVRHQKVYDLVMKLEGEGYPVRVVAVWAMLISEIRGKGYKGSSMFWTVLTVKDWDDPIFPGIWGAFKSNTSTNAFLNVFMDFLIGTSDFGNGSCQYGDCGDLFPEDEEVCIIDGQWIGFRGTHDNYQEFMDM